MKKQNYIWIVWFTPEDGSGWLMDQVAHRTRKQARSVSKIWEEVWNRKVKVVKYILEPKIYHFAPKPVNANKQ